MTCPMVGRERPVRAASTERLSGPDSRSTASTCVLLIWRSSGGPPTWRGCGPPSGEGSMIVPLGGSYNDLLTSPRPMLHDYAAIFNKGPYITFRSDHGVRVRQRGSREVSS